MVVIKNNVLATRIWSSFVMFFIFILLVYSNNLVFIFLTQIILFLANWELLRLLEYRRKKQLKDNLLYSNWFLSRCRVPTEDYITIFLINFFILSIFLSFMILKYIAVTVLSI